MCLFSSGFTAVSCEAGPWGTAFMSQRRCWKRMAQRRCRLRARARRRRVNKYRLEPGLTGTKIAPVRSQGSPVPAAQSQGSPITRIAPVQSQGSPVPAAQSQGSPIRVGVYRFRARACRCEIGTGFVPGLTGSKLINTGSQGRILIELGLARPVKLGLARTHSYRARARTSCRAWACKDTVLSS